MRTFPTFSTNDHEHDNGHCNIVIKTAPIKKLKPYGFNLVPDDVLFADELSFNPTC